MKSNVYFLLPVADCSITASSTQLPKDSLSLTHTGINDFENNIDYIILKFKF